MKNNKITIGQMAKLNHTTLATLRLYDEKGLLKPIEVNPKSNYRIYDVRQSMANTALRSAGFCTAKVRLWCTSASTSGSTGSQ